MTTLNLLLTKPGLIQKVLALLDSDHAGEARAAALALKRLLGGDCTDASAELAAQCTEHQQEIEACLTYATDAVAVLTSEIDRLRNENARLRAMLGKLRNRTAPAVHLVVH